MKPLGRKNIQLPGAKHHPKQDGKNLPGWWEGIATDSNGSARQKAKEVEDFDNECYHCGELGLVDFCHSVACLYCASITVFHE